MTKTEVRRLQQIADLAESISATCEEIAGCWEEWADPEGDNAAERREWREDAEARLESFAGELVSEASKISQLLRADD